MSRLLAAVAVTVLIGAACGDAAAPESDVAVAPAVTTPAEPAPTAAPAAPTDAPASTPAPATPTTSATTAPSGPLAPDFSLALGDGGTFVLSEAAAPVYLTFWAEW